MHTLTGLPHSQTEILEIAYRHLPPQARQAFEYATFCVYISKPCNADMLLNFLQNSVTGSYYNRDVSLFGLTRSLNNFFFYVRRVTRLSNPLIEAIFFSAFLAARTQGYDLGFTCQTNLYYALRKKLVTCRIEYCGI